MNNPVCACLTTPTMAEAKPAQPIDPAVDIGHVHLKVADIDRALDFYVGVLGFELMTRMGTGRRVLSPRAAITTTSGSTRGSRGAAHRRPRGTPACFTRRSAIRPAARSPRRCVRVSEAGVPARRRLRPRRQRGPLSPRPRPERARALPGPPAGEWQRDPSTRRSSRCSPSPSTSAACSPSSTNRSLTGSQGRLRAVVGPELPQPQIGLNDVLRRRARIARPRRARAPTARRAGSRP